MTRGYGVSFRFPALNKYTRFIVKKQNLSDFVCGLSDLLSSQNAPQRNFAVPETAFARFAVFRYLRMRRRRAKRLMNKTNLNSTL